MRLQAFLARAGASPSRRKAEADISSGRVLVNGRTAQLGAKVSEDDEVLLDGKRVSLPTRHAYFALNKPPGYLTTMSDDFGRDTVADLMPDLPGLVPVGRLDAHTTGLLLLTNDGDFAHRVTHPSSEIEKEYRLTVRVPAPPSALEALAAGPDLEDGPMLPPKLTNVKRTPARVSLNLTIHEGRNRIIRRACEAVGLDLISLERIRVGPARLGDLPPGLSRSLSARELEGLSGEVGRTK